MKLFNKIRNLFKKKPPKEPIIIFMGGRDITATAYEMRRLIDEGYIRKTEMGIEPVDKPDKD